MRCRQYPECRRTGKEHVITMRVRHEEMHRREMGASPLKSEFEWFLSMGVLVGSDSSSYQIDRGRVSGFRDVERSHGRGRMKTVYFVHWFPSLSKGKSTPIPSLFVTPSSNRITSLRDSRASENSPLCLMLACRGRERKSLGFSFPPGLRRGGLEGTIAIRDKTNHKGVASYLFVSDKACLEAAPMLYKHPL